MILDDEFSFSSSQLWELAIIEKVSGKVLINTRVDHGSNWNHKSPQRIRIVEVLSLVQAAKLLQPSPKGTIDLVASGIAQRLRDAGINPDIIFLVWHFRPDDLRILRKFLESHGQRGILPTDENCMMMPKWIRQNLPRISGNKLFPVALEVFLSLFYPHHDLVGLNHRALIDCLQTRLIVLLFEWLCRSVKDRGQQWFTQQNSQRSILDFFPKANVESIESDNVIQDAEWIQSERQRRR